MSLAQKMMENQKIGTNIMRSDHVVPLSTQTVMFDIELLYLHVGNFLPFLKGLLEVSADLVCHWRDVFLERAAQVFADPRSSGKASQEQERIAELKRLVGRLTMELDASKKLPSSHRSGGERSSGN